MSETGYRCKKCNSIQIFIKTSGNHTGAYCKKCGKFIKWLDKREIIRIQAEKKTDKSNEEKIGRIFHKKNGIITINCSKCGCQLYNSMAPTPVGQFDLVDAKFCPKCGGEFI